MAATWLYDTVQSIIEAARPEAQGVRDWHAFEGNAPPKVCSVVLKDQNHKGRTVVVGADWVIEQLAVVVEEFNRRVVNRTITEEQFFGRYDVLSDETPPVCDGRYVSRKLETFRTSFKNPTETKKS